MRDVMELIEDESQRATMARAFIKQDKLDTIQMLSDLKYLKDAAFEDGVVTAHELKTAIRQFRIEYLAAYKAPASTSNFRKLWEKSGVGKVQNQDPNRLTQEELYLFRHLVGLEGELTFQKFPEQLDVCRRVAFYRFSIYGLFEEIPDTAQLKTQQSSLEAVLDQLRFEDGLPEFLNILGTQHKLSEFCQSSAFSEEEFIGPIFFFDVKKAKEFNRVTGQNIRLTKSADFLDSLPNAKIKTALTRILNADSDAIEKQVKDYISLSVENRFILRVLQVKLWVFGLYQGKLDHHFGPYSVEALKQLLDLIFHQEANGEEDLKNILYIINAKQCVVNFQYLLYEHIIRIESKGNSLTLNNYYQLLEGRYENHQNANVRKEAENLSKEVETSLITHANNLRGLERPRKMYKGKNGFRKFLSRIVKGIKNVVGKIISFIKKLIKLIGKTIKFVFEEIKEGFLIFKRGLSFLFGQRKVKVNPEIMSDYDFDFDGYTVLYQTSNSDQLREHSREVQLRAQALYPSITFVVEVIRWGSRLSTPIGWVKVLIKMASLLKEVIMRGIKN